MDLVSTGCKAFKEINYSYSYSNAQGAGKKAALKLLESHSKTQDAVQVTNNINKDLICTGTSMDCYHELQSYIKTHADPMKIDIVFLPGSTSDYTCHN